MQPLATKVDRFWLLRRPWLPGLAVLLLGLASFAQCLWFGYVLWDDNVLILENPLLGLPWKEAIVAFSTSYYHGDYMPLTLATYWVEKRLWQNAAMPAHAINLCLHLINVALVAWLLQGWRISGTLKFFLLGMFALHPTQVESVVWVSERKGLLASSFYLLAWNIIAKDARWVKLRVVLYTSFYGIACLAKTNGIALPFWLALWDLIVRHKRLSVISLRHAAAIALALTVAWLRIDAYRSSLPDLALGQGGWSLDAILLRLDFILVALGFYIEKLLWPMGLSIIYPNYATLQQFAYLRVLAISYLALICVLSVWRRQVRLLLAGLFFLAMLLPVMHVVLRINFVNDRYLYLANIGFFGSLVVAGQSLAGIVPMRLPPYLRRAGRVLGAGVCGLSVLGASALTHARSRVFADDLTLWTATVATAPFSGLAFNNLGQSLGRLGRVKEAEAAYTTAVDLGKNQGTAGDALNNLAIMYGNPEDSERFNLPRALALLQAGIDLAPRPEEAFVLRFNQVLLTLNAGDAPAAISKLDALIADLQASPNRRFLGLLDQALGIKAKLASGPR